ncbi:hypothetical protein WJX81_004264 [Elliptochloris bilobata]|uniref:Uncharacterized protein n=1 Tax=Elliptochloris bilobata TaxID=381761 RepID=A0AAW1S0Y3_9CHLO
MVSVHDPRLRAVFGRHPGPPLGQGHCRGCSEAGYHCQQVKGATIAEAARYYLFLARRIEGAKGPPEFKAHCMAAFNERYDEIFKPELQLALFLHPHYRAAVWKKFNILEVYTTAACCAQRLGKTQAELAQLGSGMRAHSRWRRRPAIHKFDAAAVVDRFMRGLSTTQ